MSRYISTKKLVQILEEFSIIYKSIGNSIKSVQYSKASLSVKNYKKKRIYSGQEIYELKWIGKGIMSKVDEYINTGKIKVLENFRKDKKIKAYIHLTSIYGIGPRKAKELIQNKIYTINDLKNVTLTKAQQIGVKYHKYISKKIDRKEAEKIHKKLNKIFISMYKNGKTKLLGSYHLGKKKIGDIDLIICVKNKNNILSEFITKLYEKKILVESLSSKKIPDKTSVQYSGIIKSKSFVHVPWDELPFHTLYFGSGKYFSKMIRKHAKDKGYKLNEKGLYKNNKKIIVKNEKDIFNILQLKWIPSIKRSTIIEFI